MDDFKVTSNLLHSNHQLLNIFRCYDDLDRVKISTLMNQSWPTIAKNIEDLKKANILGKSEYTINGLFGYYVGISIGGSQIKLTFIDLNFNAISRVLFEEYINKYKLFKKLTYLKHQSAMSEYGYVYVGTPNSISELQTILDDLLCEVIEFDKQLTILDKHICGIGLAFTGAIDNVSKKIIEAYSLKCFNTLPLSYDSLLFDKRLSYFVSNNINIAIDNIAKSAIVSEKFALYDIKNTNARYSHKKNIGCIYLGSGIGSGLIFNNVLYRGTSNFSELGHIDVINPDFFDITLHSEKDIDKNCSCGGENCLEHKIRKYVFGLSFEAFKSLSANDLKTYFCNMDNSDYRLKLMAFYIGEAVKIMTNMLNLGLIVLTGKLTVFMDDLSKYLYIEKSNNPIGYTNSDCSIVSSTYGALAPSIGVAITSSFPNESEEIVWK